MPQVLNFHVKIDSRVCSFIQVLPDSNPCQPGPTTLKALNTALDVGLGGSEVASSKLRTMAKNLKTFRSSTKQLIHSVRNALQLLYPEYTFADSTPERLLAPAENRERYKMSQAEIALLGLDATRTWHFLWDPSDAKATPDCYPPTNDRLLRLVWSGDEGTEQFLAYQYLTAHGVHMQYYPDICHKIHRKQTQAIACVAESASLLKKLCKLFRAARGPWDSARFGRAKMESRERMLDALQAERESPVLECLMQGLCRDNAVDSRDMTPSRAISLLTQNAGLSVAAA